MFKEIPQKAKNKCNIKAYVKNYKNCDDIWIFYTEKVYIRTESENISTDKLKIVACDSQMKVLYDIVII
jgi:hypothetical protein